MVSFAINRYINWRAIFQTLKKVSFVIQNSNSIDIFQVILENAYLSKMQFRFEFYVTLH